MVKTFGAFHAAVEVYGEEWGFYIWNLIRWDVLREWPSRRYHIIHSNCIHFCDELLKLLGAKPVPAWVRGLHETGAALMRLPWPLSLLGSSTDAVTDAEAQKDKKSEEQRHEDALPRRRARAMAEE
eukprot:CAMPEP_0168473982 /NCGR_PEP_ID=MMETSP0228-20121227/60604_1 /TAXON_ID=133427 /ORGANISM="Protoceratium reticulatum, Strain CCCM 535 (=CCMP 1889)" /LENGTH=125 /DNA_ID=CAMNT_0008489991 /DNA_START=35 /DNA_END=409 /DNA_ORIENTATION=+